MCEFSRLEMKTKYRYCNHAKRKKGSVNVLNSAAIFISYFILLFGQLPSVVHGENTNTKEETEGIHIASWNWEHVGVFITVTAFIVLSGLAKVGMMYIIFWNNILIKHQI